MVPGKGRRKKLTALKNIGEVTAGWLESIGIHDSQDLEGIGAVEAYRRVKAAYPERVSLNCLYALQGALLDIHWNTLPPQLREDLRGQADL